MGDILLSVRMMPYLQEKINSEKRANENNKQKGNVRLYIEFTHFRLGWCLLASGSRSEHKPLKVPQSTPQVSFFPLYSCQSFFGGLACRQFSRIGISSGNSSANRIDSRKSAFLFVPNLFDGIRPGYYVAAAEMKPLKTQRTEKSLIV